MQKDLVFATSLQEFIPLLEAELQALNLSDIKPGYGGVFFKLSDFSDLYRVNLASRIAHRVLLPLLSFRAANKNDLYKKVKDFDWAPFFKKKDHTLCIDVTGAHGAFKNTLYAAQVVKDAICDQFKEKKGWRPSVDTKSPTVRLSLHLSDKESILSFDTSGEPLYKRGWRVHSVEAPLAATVAAGILQMAELKPTDIVCDPCCGSGTFLIEAALILQNQAPGLSRLCFGFMNHPDFDEAAWGEIKKEFQQKIIPLESGHLFGFEIDPISFKACQANIANAKLLPFIEVALNDFTQIEPLIAPTLVVANPPYGRRLQAGEDLSGLYRKLGDFLKRKVAKPGRGYVLTGDLALSKEVGLRPKRRIPLTVSGIDCRLLAFDLY